MIDKLTVRNFTVFDECKFDFSPRVNVIVGENGTGKTHLLKAVYSLLALRDSLESEQKPGKKVIGEALANMLRHQFQVRSDTLSAIHKNGSGEKTSLACSLSDSSEMTFSFGARSKTTVPEHTVDTTGQLRSPVFIPAKEVISFIEGISELESDQTVINNIFDGSYLNIMSLLSKGINEDASELEKDPRLGSLLPDLCEAVGGQFEIDRNSIEFQPGSYKESKTARGGKTASQLGDSTEQVFVPIKGESVPGGMAAEGFKKLGVLQQLLRNGSLIPGVSGPLLWDEPEANVNPKLMRLIAESILSLSRNGQQVILATHDYAMLKWFDLLEDASLEDDVRYHALYRDECGKVQIETCSEYRMLNENAISNSFAEIYDAEVSRALGPAG